MTEHDHHIAERDRIRQFREERGWSMRELATRTNSSASTINSIEKGKTQLTWNWIVRLANAFGVRPWEIVQERQLELADWQSREDLQPLEEEDIEAANIRVADNQRIFRVRSDVLSDLGIRQHSIVAVDTRRTSADGLVTGDIVAGEYFDGAQKYMLMRQFIEPRLLITNSVNNQASIHLEAGSFKILGVVVSATSHFLGRSKSSQAA